MASQNATPRDDRGAQHQRGQPRTSRRQVLQAALAGAVVSRAGLTAAEPLLGLIMPVEQAVPPEAAAMYPRGIRFQAVGLDLKTMTPQGYDAVLERIVPAAKGLMQQGAQALVLMGTSLSFYKGAAFNRELTQRLHAVSGVPAVTMSTAVIEGLRSVGAKRLAVATAYEDEVNERLRSFLQEEGFEVLKLRGLGVVNVGDIHAVTDAGLLKFSAEVCESAGHPDALLVSCGGLRTLDLLAPLERRCGVPVVSSLPHALRAGVRLLGHSGRVAGHGRLLSS
jgi:arylmalonate decarboxylase